MASELIVKRVIKVLHTATNAQDEQQPGGSVARKRIVITVPKRMEIGTNEQLLKMSMELEILKLKRKVERLKTACNASEIEARQLRDQLKQEQETCEKLWSSIAERNEEIGRLNSNIKIINENNADSPVPKSARSPVKSYFEVATEKGTTMGSRAYQGGLPSLGKRR